jgi:hypothetical protein
VIDQVLPENSGQYVCEALNNFGGQQNELTIRVVTAPKVSILPNNFDTEENSRTVYECIIKNRQNDERCSISWIFDGKVLEKVSWKS